MNIDRIQDGIILVLALSQMAQWYKFYRWPSKMTSVRGKIVECSKCHCRVSKWTSGVFGDVCVNCKNKK